MNITELRTYIEQGDYSSATKASVMQMLEGKLDLTDTLLTEVKGLLQKELVQDMLNMGVDLSTEPEVMAIQQQYDADLQVIDDDLQQDMRLVETELDKVEQDRKQVIEVSDQLDADQIRQNISNMSQSTSSTAVL